MVQFYIGAVTPYTLPRCRYLPSCSQYALKAFQQHGFSKGCVLAMRRILRCHPWGGTGYDPVP